VLKIKDDVDLKELEKFGFKPKYDEDTGELKLLKKAILNDNENEMLVLKVESLEYWRDVNDFFNNCKRNPFYKVIYVDGNLSFENGKMFMDILYDLIQAGLVEKVDDKQ
jgi:hypothetical protein